MSHKPADAIPFQSPAAERPKTFHSSDFTFSTLLLNRHRPSIISDIPGINSDAQATGESTAAGIADQNTDTTLLYDLHSDDDDVSSSYSIGHGLKFKRDEYVVDDIFGTETEKTSQYDFDDHFTRLTNDYRRRKISD